MSAGESCIHVSHASMHISKVHSTILGLLGRLGLDRAHLHTAPSDVKEVGLLQKQPGRQAHEEATREARHDVARQACVRVRRDALHGCGSGCVGRGR